MNTRSALVLAMMSANAVALAKLEFRPETIISLVALVIFNLSMSDVVSGTKSKRALALETLVIPTSFLLFLVY